jgi:hypothetical protein
MPPSAPSDPGWNISFSGQTTIVGQTVDVSVFLLDGKPALVALDALDATPPLHLSDLFDSLFKSAGLSWPTDIVDLTLSDSYIFYSYVPGASLSSLSGLPQPVLDHQANVSGEGLFITTDISLEVAGKNFAGSAFITVIPNQGFSVTGTLNDRINFLDADFLYLTEPGSPTGGPTLSIQSFGTRQFTLNCGCTLFGERLGDTKLIFSTTSPELTATLKSSGTIPPFSQPLELDFTWDRKNGFELQNFPSLSLRDVPIDFTKLATLLSEASKAKGCGALKDLVLRDGLGIQTNFKVKPSLQGSNGTVAILIEGYYKFGVLGRVVGMICFPPLSFDLPSNLTFDGISHSLIDNIVSNAERIIEALWDDKDALAFILMIIMTKKAFENMISQLVCDDLKDQLQDLDNNWDPPPDPPPPSPGSGGGGGGGGAGASLNLGGLIAAGAAAISITRGIGKTLGSIGSSIGSLFDDDDDSGPPEPPATITATYSAGPNSLVVAWLSQAFFKYDVQLVDSTGKVVWRAEVEANSDFLSQDPDSVSMSLVQVPLVNGVYTPRVRVEFFFTVTDWTTTTIAKLASPANLVMSCDATGENVIAQWAAVGSATQYTLTILDANTSAQVLSITYLPPAGAVGTLTRTFSASEIGNEAAASYLATVQALAGDTSVPSDVVETAAPLSKFAAPATVSQAVVADALRVTWTPVGNQTSYQVIVFYMNTSTEVASLRVGTPTVGSAGLMQEDLSINTFAVKSPGQYQASVRALGDATHIASNPTVSSNFNVLFGIGGMQVGTTFSVS